MNEIVIRIPAALRAFTGGADELRAAPGTVGQLLDELHRHHPQLRPRLLTPEGALRPFVNVYRDRTNIRSLDGLATQVPAGAVISILPAVAGG